MSDYSAPVKSNGDQWAAGEHNDMRTALNSKQDKSNMVQDLAAPSNTTYPSSAAVAGAVDPDNTFKYRGIIAGTDDLNTKVLPGFYMPNQFLPPTMHPSYPGGDGATTGVLKVYKNEDTLMQEFIVVDKEGPNVPGVFYRTYDGFADYWGPWRKMASEAWVTATFMPASLPPGEPTITAATGITLDTGIAGGCTDLKGLISFVNNSGAPILVGTLITIAFEHERPGLKSIQLTGYVQSVLNVTPYSPPSATEVYIRINEDLPDGLGGAFFYEFS